MVEYATPGQQTDPSATRFSTAVEVTGLPTAPVGAELEPSVVASSADRRFKLTGHDENGFIGLEVALGLGAVTAGTLAINGLRKWRNGRAEARAERQEESANIYRMAAEDSAAQGNYTPYNPNAAWFKANRVTKGPYTPTPNPRPRDTSREAVTLFQQGGSRRANLRMDARRAKGETVAHFTSLYGDILYDKDAVKRELKSGRYTFSQRRAMKGASRQVRKSVRAGQRIEEHLADTIDGTDIPGKVLRRRYRHNERIGDREIRRRRRRP